ncbi:hypothetical protein [Rhizobium ruizarguesonis]|uniref:hypothetical protein n=1 Tax=Rhizobium ruizarguesonis TaxID=2081791 RepID=UPI000416DACE|nr:hypothetical protein [Rhizobium ruizarguesonis]QJS27458.1 hypothetical protein RLTA1_09245 [Rhizobium leguminosarum bv. trifolii TA1]UFW96212.1 hypothetical protein RlegTA1_09210 [Rhizobium ruizarguesonis]
MSDTIDHMIEQYFFSSEPHSAWVTKNKRDTIAFIQQNTGDLSLVEEDGRQKWMARLLGGQNIGDACLAAYYLTSASKIPVQFDANGTRFLIAEIG